MPTSSVGHAPPSAAQRSRQMPALEAERSKEPGPPNLTPDQDTIASKAVGKRRKSDKQSLDYALRSGLAGGLAGCAVCNGRTFDA